MVRLSRYSSCTNTYLKLKYFYFPANFAWCHVSGLPIGDPPHRSPHSWLLHPWGSRPQRFWVLRQAPPPPPPPLSPLTKTLPCSALSHILNTTYPPPSRLDDMSSAILYCVYEEEEDEEGETWDHHGHLPQTSGPGMGVTISRWWVCVEPPGGRGVYCTQIKPWKMW